MGLRVSIIGLGSIGTRHYNNILTSIDDVEYIYVYDVSKERLAKDDLKDDKVRIIHDKQGFVEQDTDIAFIFTPNNCHYEDSIEFVKKGIPVFIEKPVTIKSEEARELLESAITHIFVGCNMRYHPGVQNAYDLIKEGSLGEVVYARAHFGHSLKNWRPGTNYRDTYSAKPELGGGVIWDGIHELDYLIWLFGDIEKNHAVYENKGILDIETEEIAEMVICHYSKVISNIHLDYLQTTKRRGLEIIGSEGTYLWTSVGKNPEQMTIQILKNNKEAITLYDGEYHQMNDAYIEQTKEVFAVLKGKDIDETRLLTIETASREVEVIENIKRSRN